jgi:hypothetical protein
MSTSDLTVIDTVTADTLVPNDQITFMDRKYQEIMLVLTVVDDGGAILITGESYQSGDRVTYILDPFREVDLWTV